MAATLESNATSVPGVARAAHSGSARGATAARANRLLEGAIERARTQTEDSDEGSCATFIERYYAHSAPEDLCDYRVEDLLGSALAHWNFATGRAPDSARVRAYNPDPERHGWQSTHTIIEIVCDDRPFVVDSVRMAVNALGLTVHALLHPILHVSRDDGLVLMDGDADAATLSESWLRLEVDRQSGELAMQALEDASERALVDVRAAVDDWPAMCDSVDAVITELRDAPPVGVAAAEVDENRAFLEWVRADHFTFLGYREYVLNVEDGEDVLRVVDGTGLGVLRTGRGSATDVSMLSAGAPELAAGVGPISESFAVLPADLRQLAREPHLLIVTKANARATVHRPSYLDYIGVKRFDADGRVIGERRFLGLFTSAAYVQRPKSIPLLRRKAEYVIAQLGRSAHSHAGKALANIIDTFPRDLLIQIDAEQLAETALAILHLQERQRVRLFVHRDRFRRFYICLVYMPRERYNTRTRQAVQELLSDAFGATDVQFEPQLSEAVLARVYFELRVPPGSVADYDHAALEAKILEATRNWTDELRDALHDRFGEERGSALFKRYGEAFRADYRGNYTTRLAVHDVQRMEGLPEDGGGLALSLYRPMPAANDELRFKLFTPGKPATLSSTLPMLENMGLVVEEESPSKIKRSDGPRVWLHDFVLRYPNAGALDLDDVQPRFQGAFARVWSGDMENDGFNRLVLGAGLQWRQVMVLRAYCKYLRQGRSAFSEAYMQKALDSHPKVAAQLIALFEARFDPAAFEETEAREAACTKIVEKLHSAFEAIVSLDEDRILRAFLALILASMRVSYFQRDEQGEERTWLAIKVNPAAVPDLPAPLPKHEIFFYSPRVEGVHLRGGDVARGGLRWSDRREDFRTEVLGLMKAQVVKNAVIVPVGSKGGFVPKRLPVTGGRDAIAAEGVACYRMFVSGLLDVTDNLVGGEIVPPIDLVRHDPDDPYLVVAADKGTATFSDIANEVSTSRGFWLGDAFASGGSQGYDHKGMGITAKGAWESVMRHFRELGTDTQSERFTVVGIGDMSGDVFGNGMLLSPHIALMGAFNHLHIFLDPEPDVAASFAERERLFALPRSSWADYDHGLISAGGGIHARTAKSITLSPQVQRMLDVHAETMTPTELIRAMLRSPVDLLWNGGIGTYVKASSEHHNDVGDRANDAVRVDGGELRCRVVGEGGNLGFTQLGRVEFASQSGRVNTDAIDNSAGVDCSDHEVNIKILLDSVVDAGDLTSKQRNSVLAEMTDEVGELVLRNNYLQTQALSMAVRQSSSMLEVHERLIRALERAGRLDRAIEFLPDHEAIAERATANQGLVSPELSVLMAYVKIGLFSDLLESPIVNDPCLQRELAAYFPRPLRERFADSIPTHRLAAEIISTLAANEFVNRSGITAAFRFADDLGASAEAAVRSYYIVRDVFDLRPLWDDIEALDNQVPARIQAQMMFEVRKLSERCLRWVLRHVPHESDIDSVVERYQPAARQLAELLPGLLPEAQRQTMQGRMSQLNAQGVPAALASRIGLLEELVPVFDLASAAVTAELPLEDVAEVHEGLVELLELGWMRDAVTELPRDDRWEALGRGAMREELFEQTSARTRDVLAGVSDADSKGLCGADKVARWHEANKAGVARWRQVVAEMKGGTVPNFTMLSVAMRELRALGSTGG